MTAVVDKEVDLPSGVRRPQAAFPRWSIGAGYAVLWALGAGFTWLPLALLRLVALRRWRRPSVPVVAVGVVVPLVVSLGVALTRGPELDRVGAAVFLLVPWLLLVVASCSTWTSADVRGITRGLVDLAAVQGLLVLVAHVAYPHGRSIVLPLGRVLPDSVALTPPLDAWTTTNLAFPDFYKTDVIRTAGIMGNPTWAGAIAAVAVLCLLLRPRDHVGGRWWTWAAPLAGLAGAAVTLLFAYSRNDQLGLVLGLAAGLALATLVRLRRTVRRLVVLGAVLAGGVALAVTDLGLLFRDFNAPRAGSLDARQAIYVQTLRKIHEHNVLLGSGTKEAGQDLVASLGSHSTYLGLVYRGGWLAFWAFVLLLLSLLALSCLRRSPLALGISAFTVLWCSAEDVDAGHLLPVALVLVIALVQRPDDDPAPLAPQRLALQLLTDYADGRRSSVTWFNHWSAMQCERRNLDGFTYVGLDGNGLRWLLDDPAPRTSADLVLPLLLPRLRGARVALVGGKPKTLAKRVDALTALLPADAAVVGAIDGFEGRLEGEALRAWVAANRADVVLLASGAPLQEQMALDLGELTGVRLAATCGGFLDQVAAHHRYYPAWAYPLRLNWLVRVSREPRRLWRRYTLSPLAALHRRRRLRTWLAAQDGYRRCTEVCLGER